MTPDDAILPFRLDVPNMRGRIVRLDGSLATILRQHRYPTPVAALVAEAVILTALIGQAMELRWRFSLQVRGEGPVRLIATDYFAPEKPGMPARIRAYAGFDRGDVASSRLSPFEMLGEGAFAVTIDQGPGMRPYQGITPLSGGSLAACAETYFAQSEQIATRFAVIGAEAQTPGGEPHWRGAGLMIQQMPDEGGHAPDAPSGGDNLMSADDGGARGARGEEWNRENPMIVTLDSHEGIGQAVRPQDHPVWLANR